MAMATAPAILVPGEPVQGAELPASLQVYGNASLYVGDLDLSVGDEELFQIFKQVVPVVSVRVCRDQVRQTSLGYGYVNFNTQEHAVTAMEALNCTPINGKSIRVMFVHRDPTTRKNNKANLFIKNLDTSIDNKSLLEIFSSFGTVISCKVNTDSTGKSLGYGFVQFNEEKSAENAISSLNGMLVNDKKVFVGYFVSKQEREQGSKNDVFTNVYVKNVPEGFSEEDLRNEFGVFGEITSVVVMRDENGNSKCFGFVNFANADMAKEAVEKLNGKGFEDKVLYVGRAQKKSERERELRERFERERIERREKMQGLNLFMKNLDESIDDENIRDLFSKFGEVTSCKVMVDALGKSKGYGFVALTTSESANKAINEMNGKVIGRKPLYIAFAQRKEDRRAMLVAHFAELSAAGAAGTMMSAMPGVMSAGVPMPPRMGMLTPTPHPLYFGPGGAGPGLVSPHASVLTAGFGFQQMRPATPGGAPSFMMPYNVPPPLHRSGHRRGAPHQHHPQQVTHGSQGYSRYMQNERSNIPISALTTALASASPDKQREILGERLYPLVEQIEREHVGKVTGMLLEMDETEVLHLIESPDALQSKVNEALHVLRLTLNNN